MTNRAKATEQPKPTVRWRALPEAGTVLGIRFVAAVATFVGRAAASAVVWFLALYYVVVSRRTRRASTTYLARIGQAPSFGRVLRHVHTFARVAVDRLFFLRGKLAPFVIETNNEPLLLDAFARKTGAIMLGSHLGSFEALRAVGRGAGMRLSIVVDARSAKRLARVLEAAAKDATIDVIPVDPDGMGTALKVRRAIQRGDLVGILADRVMDKRNVTVDFLGAPASFPAGPYLLAHALRCPVFLVFGLFTEPNRYDLYCEPFAEPLELSREGRERDLEGHAQRYADRLAHYARKAPFNWFNFYDFWS